MLRPRGLADQILANANVEAETIRRQAELAVKEEVLKRREDLETEFDRARRDLREQERRIEKRADLLDQKLDLQNKKEIEFAAQGRSLAEQQEEVRQRRAEAIQSLAAQLENLQRISHLSADDARKLLLKRVEDELRGEVGNLILKYQATVHDSCQQKSREILTTTIQRYAASHTAEITVSTVDIPNDEMKGRIIGREGRNIRAFEKGHRRGRDCRRHTRRGDRDRFRQHPPRGRQDRS